MAMAPTGHTHKYRDCLIAMPRSQNILTDLFWRSYIRLQLSLQPARFFRQLYGLDWYQTLLHDWLVWLHPPAGSHILEAGCSSGEFSAYMAQQGYFVTGVDRALGAMRLAQQHRPCAHLHFVVGDARQLPLQQRYHYSLAASLLNVVDTPAQFVSELARLTAANGVVSCLFPNPAMDHERAAEYIDTHALHGFSATALTQWAQLANKLDPATVTPLFLQAGLKHVRTTALFHGMVSAVAATVEPCS